MAYAAIPGADPQDKAECPDSSWRTFEVESTGWLHLSIRVEPTKWDDLIVWLGRRSADRRGLTHEEVLRAVVSGMEAGLNALASPRGRPRQVTFELQIARPDCTTVRTIQHSAAQARRHLRLPMLVQTPAMLGSYDYDGVIRDIAAAVSHEGAHILQLMPFGAASKRWVEDPAMRTPDHVGDMVNVEVEVGAMLVELCLRQAVLPQTVEDEIAAAQWLQDRAQFLTWASGIAPRLKVVDRFLATLSAHLGRELLGIRAGARLERLFALCAMAIHRPQMVLDPNASPNDREAKIGAQALRGIRQRVQPIYLTGRRYSGDPVLR